MTDEPRIFNEDEKDVLYEAMKEAQKAFNERVDEEYDAAYFELDMTGYVLSGHDLSRQSMIEMGEVEEEDEDSELS